MNTYGAKLVHDEHVPKCIAQRLADFSSLSNEWLQTRVDHFRENLYLSCCNTDPGVMTDAGLYPSSRMKKSRNLRAAGLGNKSRSRATAGSSVLVQNHNNQARRASSRDQFEGLDQQQQQQGRVHNTREDGGGDGDNDIVRGERDQARNDFQGVQSSRPAVARGAARQRGARRQRPSTALEAPSPALLAQAPDAPLTSRVGAAAGRFAGAGARILTYPSCHNEDKNGAIGSGGSGGGGAHLSLSAAAAAAAAVERGTDRVSAVEIRRTQWVDRDIKGGRKEGGWVSEAGVTGQQQQPQQVRGKAAGMAKPDTNDEAEAEAGAEEEGSRGDVDRGGGASGGDRDGDGCRRRSSTSSVGSTRRSAPRLAWGNAMREVTTTVSKVVSDDVR